MRNLFALLLLLLSFSLSAHQHHPDTASENIFAYYSTLWNIWEITNHAAALAGFGETHCCGHGSKLYHISELAGHTTNLAEDVSHFIERNLAPPLVSGLSLAFNLWATMAQLKTIHTRGIRVAGIVFLVPSLIDVTGHLTSAYFAVQHLIDNDSKH